MTQEELQKMLDEIREKKFAKHSDANLLKFQNQIGRKATIEHKSKISKALSGKPKSDEHKKNASKAKGGDKVYCEMDKFIKFCHKNKINGDDTYRQYKHTNKGKIPENIPLYPERYYGKKWSWIFVSGSGRKVTKKSDVLSFQIAHEYAKQTAKEKNFTDPQTNWMNEIHPYGIPRRPDTSYKDKGWVDWWHFTGIKKFELTKEQILDAQKYSDSAKSCSEYLGVSISIYEKWSKHYGLYKKMSTSDRNKKISSIRKSHGATKGYKDHLIMPIDEAKKIVSKFKFKNHKEYRKAHREGKLPKNIPSAADQTYMRLKVWSGWIDFLGKKNKHN
jgi:hypothetical protein